MSSTKKVKVKKKKTKVQDNFVPIKKELAIVPIKQKSLRILDKVEVLKQAVKTISLVTIIGLIIAYVILLVIIATSIFYVQRLQNGKIQTGIFIGGINVSDLTKEEATNTLNFALNENIPEYINLKYNQNTYRITLADLMVNYDIENSVEEAYSIGRTKNIARDLSEYIDLMNDTINIDYELKYDEKIMQQFLNQISSEINCEVTEYSYEIKDNLLIINSGKKGVELDFQELENRIVSNLKIRNFDDIEIPTTEVFPQEIDIEKIHSEVFVEPQDAYFTENPITIHEQVIGVDFDVEEAKNIIVPNSEQYKIELIFTKPNIFVKDLNIFPDELSTFSTNYVNNYNRTTNLILAANKINGTVLMPREKFSFNEVVGERTVSAGYKNAAIFVNGQVEDGLAGGICQISSTLYNAVIGADLEIEERHNHSKLTSYLPGGKDATVAWGRYDFQFVNNREYPIKIEMSVQNGKANAKIFGIRTENEYEIKIETQYTGKSGIYAIYNAYKVYSQNGIEIKREFLSRDLYK